MYYDRYDDYDFYALFACEELHIGLRKCLITGRVSYYGVMDITPAIFPFFSHSLLRRGAPIDNGRRGQKVGGNLNDFCKSLFRSH